MTASELDKIYCRWTYDLHVWVLQHLQMYISARYYPAPDWTFELFEGIPQESHTGTVPKLEPAPGAQVVTLTLPRPEDHPEQQDVDAAFRKLCIAAALILQVDLGKSRLSNGSSPRKLAAPDQAHES